MEDGGTHTGQRRHNLQRGNSCSGSLSRGTLTCVRVSRQIRAQGLSSTGLFALPGLT